VRLDPPAFRPVRRQLPALSTALLLLLGAAAADAADLTRKEPYLIYPGNPTEMRVLWQLTATDTARIEWGTDTTCALGSVGTTEYGADHQHAYTIGGLTPATRYYYRVTNEGVPHRGSFRSAPAATAMQLKFLAYGDTRTYPAVHNTVAGDMLSALATDPDYQTLCLFMGDFVTTGTSESYWTSEFFFNAASVPDYPNIRALMGMVAFQSCIGNHEGTGTLFTKYFPYPFTAGRYYSFDYGPAHVTVIDQYTSYAVGSPQLQWIAADLAASTKPWKFVLFHEPGWSAAGGHSNNTTVQTVLQPLFVQYGVSIAFAGHNHYYARALVDDVQHVTTGGGGAPLSTPDPLQPHIVATARANHFCQVAIDGGVLSFKAINTAGAVIDSFTIVKTLPDALPPVVTLTSPVGGEAWDVGSTHDVTWTASDNVGVDSVCVDYSPTGPGGPWLPVAHGLANSGSLPWTLPDQPTDSARVRVTAYDHALNAASDSSAGAFSILDPNAGVGDAGPAGFFLARPLPDPSTGNTLLRFGIPAAGRVRLEILDLAGRRVWQSEGDLPAGEHAWHWDGATSRGGRAGTGLYFIQLVTPWGTRSGRLVRLQ
jgi:hypothetical protein